MAAALLLLVVLVGLFRFAPTVVQHEPFDRSLIARAEIGNIVAAVKIYRERHGSYPLELGQTVTDEILSRLPIDPWGRSYFYSLRRPTHASEEVDLYVWSFGHDGELGGDGVDQDILSWN